MRNLWIIGGVATFLLFLLGIYLGVDRVLGGGGPNPGTITVGKPTIEESRRSPTPDYAPPPGPSGSTGSRPRTSPRREASPEVSQAWVIQDGAPAHQTPQPTAPKVYTLRYGDKVRPMERKDSWDRVLLPNGQPAWVQHEFLSSRKPSDLTSADDGEAGAVKVVNAFYEDLNAHRLGPAYDRLSFEWKRQLDYTTFSNGYAAITSIACTVLTVSPIDADHMTVQVELHSAERRRQKVEAGTHLVVREKGEWKLDSGDFRDVTPPPSEEEEEDLE